MAAALDEIESSNILNNGDRIYVVDEGIMYVVIGGSLYEDLPEDRKGSSGSDAIVGSAIVGTAEAGD